MAKTLVIVMVHKCCQQILRGSNICPALPYYCSAHTRRKFTALYMQISVHGNCLMRYYTESHNSDNELNNLSEVHQ